MHTNKVNFNIAPTLQKDQPNVFKSNLELLFKRRFCCTDSVLTHLCKCSMKMAKRRLICKRTVYLEITTCSSTIYAKL